MMIVKTLPIVITPMSCADISVMVLIPRPMQMSMSFTQHMPQGNDFSLFDEDKIMVSGSDGSDENRNIPFFDQQLVSIIMIQWSRSSVNNNVRLHTQKCPLKINVATINNNMYYFIKLQ
ncbi:hypothetical protein CHS0354_041551 [Potamilus streckersoni]|uniref:Uncharacterized protein n=1 Tax=Potamilus streckersoni TaxID=2493646 RepID=A0AAE0TFP0_9BIVA|nr:hypothetical protein CHS0354_041551 [Potamilus streckersoni]